MENLLLRKEIKLGGLEIQYEEKSTEMNRVMKEQRQQLEIMRTSLEKIVQDYKNEKFERNALNNAYSQALKILEHKNQDEKNLYVRIAFLQADLFRSK